MKNHIKYFALLLSLFIISCDKNAAEPNDDSDYQRIGIDSSRADAPTNGTTFGFFAYYSTENEPWQRTAGIGYYRFDSGSDTLIPCNVDADGNPSPANGYDASKGLHLYYYQYYIFYYTPALPYTQNSLGSFRIKYNLSQALKISTSSWSSGTGSPLNSYYKRILPTASYPLTEMRSDFSFNFIQEASAFNISNAKMHFVGTTALYHPRLKINEITDQETAPAVVVPLGAGSGTTLYKSTTPVMVFPADYSLENTKTLLLKFDLKIGAATASMDIPFAMDVKASVHYTINIKVTSRSIIVSYTAVPWSDYNSSENVGGSGFTKTIGTFSIPGWDDNNDNTTIG